MKPTAGIVEHARRAELDELQVDSVVIGAGQCGLSTGYYLAKQSRSLLILDENERVGDSWRRRYDSLRLYTPARYDGLPGMASPGSPSAFPTGHDIGGLPGGVRLELRAARQAQHQRHSRRTPPYRRVPRQHEHRDDQSIERRGCHRSSAPALCA